MAKKRTFLYPEKKKTSTGNWENLFPMRFNMSVCVCFWHRNRMKIVPMIIITGAIYPRLKY